MIFSFFLLKDVMLAPARKYTNFYPASCLSNEKHSKGDKTTDYLANYPCSMESFSQIETIVTQIEKQIDSQSSFNKDSGGPKNKKQNF